MSAKRQTRSSSGSVRVLLGRAMQAHQAGDLVPAQALYAKVLRASPRNFGALYALGVSYCQQGQHARGMPFLEQALAVQPEYAEAHCNLADALNALSRHDEAVAHSERALALEPASAEAHNNLGNALHGLSRPEEALPHYAQALAIRPDLAEAEANMGHSLLALGRYAEGWQPYEARWRVKGAAALPDFRRPPWLGREDIADKHLLIQCEQGLGDAILMSRYVSELEQRGAHCWIQAPPALLALLQRSFPRSRVVPFQDCPADVELRVPIMSLPLAMQTLCESDIPKVVPYLVADEQKAARWASRLATRGTRAVGLAWRGNPRYKLDSQRSTTLDTMLPLLTRQDVQFVALAHDLTELESTELAQHDNVTVPGTNQFSFDDLAAVVSVLDLVISVDSAPAHLAGALGKPVWVLLSPKPLWCWHLGRSDSPWYPTATLFRQTATGGWAAVMDDANGALTTL